MQHAREVRNETYIDFASDEPQEWQKPLSLRISEANRKETAPEVIEDPELPDEVHAREVGTHLGNLSDELRNQYDLMVQLKKEAEYFQKLSAAATKRREDMHSLFWGSVRSEIGEREHIGSMDHLRVMQNFDVLALPPEANDSGLPSQLHELMKHMQEAGIAPEIRFE